MIKAEDLRIGDLVRVREKKTCRFIPEDVAYKVTQINPNKNLLINNRSSVCLCLANPKQKQTEWPMSCGSLLPIPLTPKILEKNKFEVGYPENIYNKFIGPMRGLIRFLSIENKHTEWKVFIKYSSLDFQVLLRSVNYVHELQHILWALGEDANLKI